MVHFLRQIRIPYDTFAQTMVGRDVGDATVGACNIDTA